MVSKWDGKGAGGGDDASEQRSAQHTTAKTRM